MTKTHSFKLVPAPAVLSEAAALRVAVILETRLPRRGRPGLGTRVRILTAAADMQQRQWARGNARRYETALRRGWLSGVVIARP